jgi:hypothetical protein
MRPARKADNLTAICELIVWKTWEPRRLTTLWAATVCYRNSFTFIMHEHWLFQCIIDTWNLDQEVTQVIECVMQ